MPDLRAARWWYWLATVLLLASTLLGDRPYGLPLAIALTMVQVVHFGSQRGWRSLPLQVRVAYVAILLAGRLPGLRALLWLQLAGTVSVVTVGYCPLARCVSLLPWNRRQPFSLTLVRTTFLMPPVRGSILDALTVARPRPAT